MLTSWYFAANACPEVLEVQAMAAGDNLLYLGGGKRPIRGNGYSFSPTRQEAEQAKRTYANPHPR